MSRSLANLVYLIDEDYGVLDLCSLECLDNFAGHCTDISSSMSFKSACVSGTSQSDTDVLSTKCFGYALSNGSLSDARWSYKA